MRRSPSRFIGLGILALLLLSTLFLTLNDSKESPQTQPEIRKSSAKIEHQIPANDRSSQFLKTYSRPSSSIRRDLEEAWHVVETFNNTLKHQGSLPMGSNRELMSLLFGKNPRQIRFVDPTKSYISEKGELLDRWQTPLFFHFVEGQEIAIRSAGKDQTMWTEDDQTYGDYSSALK